MNSLDHEKVDHFRILLFYLDIPNWNYSSLEDGYPHSSPFAVYEPCSRPFPCRFPRLGFLYSCRYSNQADHAAQYQREQETKRLVYPFAYFRHRYAYFL